jgi:hypothetical protein
VGGIESIQYVLKAESFTTSVVHSVVIHSTSSHHFLNVSLQLANKLGTKKNVAQVKVTSFGDDMGLGGMASWEMKKVKWPHSFQNMKCVFHSQGI